MNNVPSRGLVIMLDKVLPEIIRVIQGDGISYNSLALCGGRGAARLDDAPCFQLISVGSRWVEWENSSHLKSFPDGFWS